MGRAATPIFYTARSVRRQPTFSPLDKSRKTFLTGVTLCMILLISASIFYIGTHVKVVNLGYKINQDIQHKEKLIEENKRLNLEIATLTSLTRIEQEATKNLGLSLPKANQVIYLSKLEEAQFPQEVKVASIPPAKLSVPPEKTEKKSEAVKSIPVQKLATMKPATIQKKKSSEVIVATIIDNQATKNSPVNKISMQKLTQLKSKENIPAVMVDPIP